MLVDDLTDARLRERELGVKEATIREVHHRVKNNLQVVSSLLNLQATRSPDANVVATLRDMQTRVARNGMQNYIYGR